ncbi:MAG: gas vesicle protein [Actinomycetia bacterium]|nr:gas vesicle protein [Actinomycetes bacterium]
MEPVNSYNAGTTDLLERILEKGVMLRLDLIISVADIPLVGLQVQLAVASIETMNAYGMLEGWDTQTRTSSPGGQGGMRRSGELVFEPGEHVVLEEFASARVELGWTRWRPGRLHITNRRVILTRAVPDEILFETRLADIMAVGTATHTADGVAADAIQLHLVDGRNVVLRSSRSGLLEAGMRDVLRRAGHHVGELPVDDVGNDDGHGAEGTDRW